MERITAIIVDDEPAARDLMASLLSDFADIQVLAKDSNVRKAIGSICKYNPDLVFLDIDMPKKMALTLSGKLENMI